MTLLMTRTLNHVRNCELSAESEHFDFFLLANTMSMIVGLEIDFQIFDTAIKNGNVGNVGHILLHYEGDEVWPVSLVSREDA